MEETVKKYIRSLLTSAPVAVQMFQLEKDYRNTIGEPIPYHKLGYNSLEHFLRSIPETVVVRGTGREAEVVPVITEKSAHINELVARQRVSTKGRHGRPLPRRYLLPPQNTGKKILYPNRQAESIKPNVLKNEPKSIQPESTKNVNAKPLNNDKYSNNLNTLNSLKPFDPVKISNLEKEVIEAAKMAKNETSSTTLADDSTSFATLNTKMLREKILLKSNSANEQHLNNSFKFGITKKGVSGDYSRENLGNSNVSVMNTSNVPTYIQKNLKKLISYHPDGIWCAQLPLIYRRMFNADLNYQEYGFRSLIELCTSLTTIFHYARPSLEDFRLYDGSKPLPHNAAKKFTVASYCADEDSDTNNALPSVDWDDVLIFLPKDIFQPGLDIPKVFVPQSTKEYDSFDVVPGEIYDISKFWVFLDNGILDELMDQMQDFYRIHHKEYHIPEHLIREGLYCVQIIFGEYHRALIVDILPDVEDMIRVLYIDYGTVTRSQIKGVCFLHEQFAEIPAQAIRCRLANIVPPLEGAPWSKQSTKCFRELITGRTLKATVIKVNWEDQFLDIFLVDVTNPERTFYINDRLVEEGHAEYPDKERKKYKVDSVHKCKVKQIHLFPTFAELEHGLAPSTAEMAVYEECGVPIYFAYPQYFDIDTTSEKSRVQTTDHWYQLKHGHKREVQMYHCDISKLRPKPLNLEYFGTLTEEIVELIKDEKLDNSFFIESNETENEVNENIEQITNQFQIMEFAEKLKKDCLLAQDIMSDLEKLYSGENSNKLNKDIYIDPAEGFWSLNDNDDFVSSEQNVASSSLSKETDENDFIDEQILLEYDDNYLAFPSRYSTISCYTNCDGNEENQILLSKIETESVASENSKDTGQSTNPFRENLHDSSFEVKSTMKTLVLNPNNPFLTYRPDKESDESSNSTVYSSVIQEVKMQSWSVEDSRINPMNNCEILSSDSASSTGSVHTSAADTYAIITKNVVDMTIDTDSSEVEHSYLNSEVQGQSDLQPPVTHFNCPQNLPTQNNYYSYPPQTTIYNQSQGYRHSFYPGSLYSFGHQYNPGSHYPHMPGYHTPLHHPHFGSQQLTTASVRPPPGFAPNSNIYQVSRIMQTTVSSNVIADGTCDFYDLYNARLKLALESATNNMS